jgi:hypothetical protein
VQHNDANFGIGTLAMIPMRVSEAAEEDREIRAGTGQHRSYDVHEICCCIETVVRAVGTRHTAGAFLQAARPCKLGVQSLPCRLGRPRTCAGIHGGIDYGSDDAGFEAKAPEGSRTGVGSRWRVFFAGERRNGSNPRFGDRHSVEGHGDGSGVRPHRRGDLRRQPRHVLCLRQGGPQGAAR